MSKKQNVNPNSIRNIGEFGLISKINSMISSDVSDDIVLHLGDDTAAIRITENKLTLITCDIQIENQHFIRNDIAPFDLGRRAVAINLSDIAAMGGIPTYAMISLGLPPNYDYREFEKLYQGFIDQCKQFDVTIVGGNLSQSDPNLIIDITLLGEIESTHLIRRDRAKPGDRIFVTGELGLSGAGFQILKKFGNQFPANLASFVKAHQNPQPRVLVGQAIASRKIATSMIDVSDGIARDLNHICESSKVGSVLYKDKLPGMNSLNSILTYIDIDLSSLQLNSGEDYELLFTTDHDISDSIISDIQSEHGISITEIGKIVDAEQGYYMIDNRNISIPLDPEGWDHFKSKGSI